MLVDLQTTPLGRLRALFKFKQAGDILIELSINPVECSVISREQLILILQAIADSQLAHFTESTSRGGEWDEVMAFAKRCHEAVCAILGHVITTLRIEEDARATNEVRGGLVEESQKAPTAALSIAAGAGALSSNFGRRRAQPH